MAITRTTASNPKGRALALAVVVLAFTLPSSAWQLDMRYGWTNVVGAPDGELDDTIVTFDSLGDILVFGEYTASADFDPGEGEDLHPCGFDCMFLTKYTSDGSYEWTLSWNFDEYSNPMDIIVDGQNDVIMTGGFKGRQDLDPGPTEDWHDAGGSTDADIFLIKISSEGEFLWAKNIGGNEAAIGARLVRDAQNNAYVTGQFRGVVDFDPSERADIHISAGLSDTFLTKFESSGDYGWTYRVGGPGGEFGAGIALDREGNIFVAGGASAGTDFDPTEGVDIQPIEGERSDVYLTRINASRTYAWTRVFGGTGGDRALRLSIDHHGNLIMVGLFDSLDADFDPGESEDIHRTQGREDVFVSKFSNEGEYLWTRSFGSDQSDATGAVAVDSAGNSYIGGFIRENADPRIPVDMDPTKHQDWRFPRDADCFLTKLDADGAYQWSGVWGSDSFDHLDAIVADDCDNLIYSGMFSENGSVDVDPTDGQDIREAIGRFDGFTSKLLTCGNGDANGDCAVNTEDYEAMFSCVDGPGVGVPTACCAFDLDRDGDVDLRDFSSFQLILDAG